jgi:hypothetical protein
MMNESTFVACYENAWWLFQVDYVEALALRREFLGRCFGWRPEEGYWYQSPEELREVYKFLRDNEPELLDKADTAFTILERQDWLERAAKAKGHPVVGYRDDTGKNATKVATLEDFIKPVPQTPEKPDPSGPPPAQPSLAEGGESPFKNSQTNDTLGIPDDQPVPKEPAAASKQSPFKQKRVVAGRDIPLALDDLNAVLSASSEGPEDPADDSLRRLEQAISDHKTASNRGWGLRLSTILGVCDTYLDSHKDASKGWPGKKVAVVEGLKAEAMLERARRQAEEQYLLDAYTKPDESATALSAQSEKTRQFAHAEAQEVGARVRAAPEDRFAGLDSNSPMAWATMAAHIYKLTEAEVLAVKVYTSDDYRYINAATANEKALMNKRQFAGNSEDYLTSKEGRAEMKRFFEEGSLHSAMAIAALQKLEDVADTCYRGTRMTMQQFEEQYGNSRRKKFPSTVLRALTSCSTKKESAEVFANKSDEVDATVSVITEIATAHARDIGDLSLYPGERELLLLPGAVVQTLSWELQGSWGDGQPEATMWVYVMAKEG